MIKKANHWLSYVATAGFAGTVLTVLAPFGTQAMTVPVRFVCWFSLVMIGGFGVMAADKIMLMRGFKGTKLLKAFWRSVGSSLGVFIILLALALGLGQTPTWIGTLQLYFYVWVVALTICLVATYVDSAPKAPQRPALTQRMKPSLRSAEIYALSAQDHYVHIITSKGEDLVLMRLADAVREIAPLPGLSPHRSWWVAEAGVKAVRKSGGKTIIILKNDTEVPVSRGAQKIVRDAGWL